jgi:hypothetical protein
MKHEILSSIPSTGKKISAHEGVEGRRKLEVLFLFLFSVLEIKVRALYMVGKNSTTELYTPSMKTCLKGTGFLFYT